MYFAGKTMYPFPALFLCCVSRAESKMFISSASVREKDGRRSLEACCIKLSIFFYDDLYFAKPDGGKKVLIFFSDGIPEEAVL